MADSFIPKKFYVARKQESVESTIGWLVPMNSDGLAARKKSADKWASGNGKLDPIEVENVPHKGYVVLDYTRRNRTDNVVWRILHPMGFQFEITSDNFSDIMFDIILDHGVIQTDMILLRHGGANILYPVDSPKYKAAKTEDEYFTKVARKDMQLGDVVTLVGSKEKMQYLGTWHQIPYDSIDPNVNISGNSLDIQFPAVNKKKTKSSRLAFFRYVDKAYDPNLFTHSSPKVNTVISQLETPFTMDEALAFIQERNWSYRAPAFAYIGEKIAHMDKMTSEFVLDNPLNRKNNGYYQQGYLRKVGETDVVHFDTDRMALLTLKDVMELDVIGTLKCVTERKVISQSSNNSYWGSRYNTTSVTLGQHQLTDPNLAARGGAINQYWYPNQEQNELAWESFVQQIQAMGYEFVSQRLVP